PPPPPPPPPPAPQLPDAPPHLSSAMNAKFPSFTMDVHAPLPDITNRESTVLDRNHVTSIPNKPWEKSLDYGKIQHAVLHATDVHDDDDDDDDDVDAMDIPHRFTMRPGAAAARLDLQRCTIRVHKQLVNQMQTHSMKPQANKHNRSTTAPSADESLSRCQGELWLKSRVPMMGWKKRYGSIVDHAYFGPVLFLFKYDAKGNVALHHSLMIVLVDSHVRLGKNSTTRDNDYRCEFVLRTTKRRYTIAANHTMRRDYWLRNLESIQRQATTSYS
ncbi:unnamed protein product, partial [Agarophyton chilense]